MSNPGHTRPGGLRPQLETLPDGRLRMTTFFKLNNGDQLTNDLIVAWGLLYSAVEKVECTGRQAHLAGLRLVGGQEAQQAGDAWVWVRVYETLPEASEITVGKPRIIRGDDGRWSGVQSYLQFSTAKAVSLKPGQSVLSTWPTAIAGITGDAGTNVITAVGHTFRDGDPVRFQTLAGGSGLITGYTYYAIYQGANQLRVSLEVGGPAVDFTTPITGGSMILQVSLVLSSEDAQDDGTLRRIERQYVSSGLISTSGPRAIEGGLMQVVWISVLVREDPPGIVVHVDTQKPKGVPVFTVTAVQSPGGGDPTASVVNQYQDEMQFEYPGRAKPYMRSRIFPGNEVHFLDVFMSPPVQTTVMGTVQVTYQDSEEIGVLPYGQWKPTAWAVMEASYITVGDQPASLVKGLSGYRVAGEPVSDTPGAYLVSCLGDFVFANNPAYLSVVGGPEDPAGNTYTLLVQLRPAFRGYDGTQYYRKVVGWAEIPAQEALPV